MVKISAARMDMQQGRIDQAVFRGHAEKLVGTTKGTNTTASYTVDLTQRNTFNLILNANCTFTFSNPFASGIACSFTLFLKQDAKGSRTVTWPASVVWPGGVAPTLTTAPNSIDVLTFFTVNGGTKWMGSPAGQNFNYNQQLSAWGYNGNGQLGLGD